MSKRHGMVIGSTDVPSRREMSRAPQATSSTSDLVGFALSRLPSGSDFGNKIILPMTLLPTRHINLNCIRFLLLPIQSPRNSLVSFL